MAPGENEFDTPVLEDAHIPWLMAFFLHFLSQQHSIFKSLSHPDPPTSHLQVITLGPTQVIQDNLTTPRFLT